MLRNLLISMRPYQWVKNVLVFAALFFSLSFFRIEAVQLSIGAFISFCLVSSGIYLINDIRDRQADKLHPEKRFRPIASGALSVPKAASFSVLLLALGLGIAYFINLSFFLLIAFYALMNFAYSMGLKMVVLVDVMIVATGFLLRAVGGAFAIGVAVSPWLFICTLMLALLLVFGKRRHEIATMKAEAKKHRKCLKEYNLPFLDGLMFVSAGAAIVTYSLYTMAEEVVARFGTEWLMATTPLVIYGVFRYLYLIYIKKDGGDPTKMMIKDKAFLINGLLYVATVIIILMISRSITP
jgi:4-hydroxybenzoate polyprenyltransferase